MSTAVEVWVADLTFPGYMDRLHAVGEAFNAAHPEYQVTVVGKDFRKLPAEIAAAAAAGRPPAVAEYYFYMTPVARDAVGPDGQPLFACLEEAIRGRREILGEPVVTADILPVVRDYYTYRGRLWSMPTVVTTMLLFGNADRLRRAGVFELPRTWGEVEAVCDAVTAEAGGGSHAITWANHGLFFQQGVAVQGGELVDQDNGRSGPATRIDLTTPEMLTWVRWWQRLQQEGHYLYTGKIPDWEGNFRAFATGEVALRITSSNDLDYMANAAEQGGFELLVGPFPHPDGAAYGGNMIAGTSLWLAAGLDEATQDGALAFMQYLNNARHSADRHRASTFVPLTSASARVLDEEGWFTAHPHHRVATVQLSSPVTQSRDYPPIRGPLFGAFALVQDVTTRAMSDLLANGGDAQERFAAATAEAQRLLDRYHDDRRAGRPVAPENLLVEYFRDAEAYSGADLENVVKLKR